MLISTILPINYSLLLPPNIPAVVLKLLLTCVSSILCIIMITNVIVLYLLVIQSHVSVLCNAVATETEHTGQGTSRDG